ncbi:pimeloyl-ACP methyl ester carboxylesterase [Paenibacillus pabuli]|uniref:Pimeloyl-ACP methyl ester carboxylesterase n=1 Tax=Paenibacillus pabuli TaxID=1472 RepID=A0ABX9BBG5_9BACL|nr:alpha/beta hydrolase [Paenibacillus pabuli]RAI84434.1 pimeloyl-ACP methyl ester carboxylesterase [Paenibacillus pabuli]
MQRYRTKEGQDLIYESYEKLLTTWNVVHEQIDIISSFGSTHIITAGSTTNPTLLLLHGTADNSAMMWIYNIQQLSERFYVIAIDAIGGSGKSEPNEKYYKQFDQTAWLDELLESLRIETTHIAGVSYGAYLAYHYAIMRPSKVKKIVCMASGVASSQIEVMIKMMKAFLPEALFPTETNCKKLLRKLSGPNYSVFENNTELMKHWYYLLKYFNNKSMMKHKLTIFNNEQIESIRDKSLFLIGEQDILSNYPKSINKLKDNQLNYKIVKQAGHAINHEQSKEVNTEIIKYLSR